VVRLNGQGRPQPLAVPWRGLIDRSLSAGGGQTGWPLSSTWTQTGELVPGTSAHICLL
jgi:hypothetical protein